MAISLNSDGLHLNYPTYTCTSAVNVPVGCAVWYQNSTGSSYGLNGTWVMIGFHTLGGGTFMDLSSQMQGYTTGSGRAAYSNALAIRIA